MVWWHLVTLLYNHHCYPFQNVFIAIKGDKLVPFLSPVVAPGNHQSLSVSMDLPVLHVLYKWDPTICDLWCLASFTEHHAFEVCHVVCVCV